MELASILESLLIASEDPISVDELAKLVRLGAEELLSTIAEENPVEILNEKETASFSFDESKLKELERITESDVLNAINDLNSYYEKSQRSFKVLERAKGWKLFTTPSYAHFVRQLFPQNKTQRLSEPAMETLAIIAYRQPITKASMEAVRGVSCDGMIQKLLDREMISISGRADLPGRPLLYQTTDIFFECFGIKSITDLPNSAELKTLKLPSVSKSAGEQESAALDNGTITNQELPLENQSN